MLAFVTIICALLSAVTAAPVNATAVGNWAQVIADGNSVHDGDLPDWNFKYHASGYVAKGCPPGTKISTCYTYSLSADPTKNMQHVTHGVNVQNVTFFGPSHPADGKVRQYTFRMKVDPALTSTSELTPLVGLETLDINDPRHRSMLSVYLDVRDDMAGIYRYDDPWTPLSTTIPLNKFVGKQTYQTWTLKSGPNGWIDVKIVDEATGKKLLTYHGVGQNSWDTYRMRVGTIRVAAWGMDKLKVYWGDWLGKYI